MIITHLNRTAYILRHNEITVDIEIIALRKRQDGTVESNRQFDVFLTIIETIDFECLDFHVEAGSFDGNID